MASAQPARRIVIVGASLAGGTAAVTLRQRDFDGAITLIGAEAHPPYERPPLSKALLLGDADEPDWVSEASYYTEHDIELQSSTVAAQINRDAHVVTAGGHELGYDKLVLATGSAARRLGLPGADLTNVLTLRTLDDALRLRGQFTEGARLVIVGAGWIGCEVAAAARHHGVHVTMIDPLAQPLVRVLGEQIGQAFAELHREHDVDLRLGTGVTGFQPGEGAAAQAVGGVALADGTVVPADLVVVGVGAVPRLELAEAAGLDLADGGVAVDAALRTSDPDIYAIGDIAAHAHPAYPKRVRVEHWANAKDQGEHVAGGLLGDDAPYTSRPFFFSDQYDLGCEYRGLADPATDRLVVRGDLGSRDFTAFWLRDGVLTAAMNVNQWDDGDALQALIDGDAKVSDDELTNGNLADVAARAGAAGSAG